MPNPRLGSERDQKQLGILESRARVTKTMAEEK
jgi:hypothetical protein